MNKRFSTIYILSAIALIVLVGVGLVFYSQNTQKDIETVENLPVVTTNDLEEVDFDSLNKTLDRHKITGVEDLEGPYKKVTVNNGEITFSFEVPDNWLTETRNSGEVEMNEEELREFLATRCIYDARIKEMYFEEKTIFSSNEESDYTGHLQSTYKNMPKRELFLTYQKEEFPSGGFPSVSTSSGCIGYRGPNGAQTNFYLLSPEEAEKYYNYNTKTKGVDEYIRDLGTLERISIDGKEAFEFIGNKTDLYGLADTRRIFIPLATHESNKPKVLIIYQQSMSYNDEVERGFQHILNSFSIQEPSL